jgi:hypothetical protein
MELLAKFRKYNPDFELDQDCLGVECSIQPKSINIEVNVIIRDVCSEIHVMTLIIEIGDSAIKLEGEEKIIKFFEEGGLGVLRDEEDSEEVDKFISNHHFESMYNILNI